MYTVPGWEMGKWSSDGGPVKPAAPSGIVVFKGNYTSRQGHRACVYVTKVSESFLFLVCH